MLINLLNPKFDDLLLRVPASIPARRPANGTWQMMGLSGVSMALTFVVLALYGVFAATVSTQLISRKVMLWLRRTFAATYVLLAGRLAAESR